MTLAEVLERPVLARSTPEATVRPSFEALYREHFPFVWRTALRLGIHVSSADDVVQEIFLVVHKKLPSFEGRSSMKTWLFAVIRRVCADHRRSRRRKPCSPLPPDGIDGVRDPSGSSRIKHFEAVDLVDRLLLALDEEKREVFILAELEQMTLAEIADALGANPNTVASRLRAARRRFDEALDRHDQEVP